MLLLLGLKDTSRSMLNSNFLLIYGINDDCFSLCGSLNWIVCNISALYGGQSWELFPSYKVKTNRNQRIYNH